jgi:hypothetical protein
MTTADFDTAWKNGRAKEALGQLCDELEDLLFNDMAKMNKQQRIVLGVASFIGQVRDGGFKAFINSPWAVFLDDLEEAFVRIGLPEYASVASRLREVSMNTAASEQEMDDAEEAFGPSTRPRLKGS